MKKLKAFICAVLLYTVMLGGMIGLCVASVYLKERLPQVLSAFMLAILAVSFYDWLMEDEK